MINLTQFKNKLRGYFQTFPRGRACYKSFCNLFFRPHLSKFNKLAQTLPPIPQRLKISKKIGHLTLTPDESFQTFPKLSPLIRRCKTLMEQSELHSRSRADKEQMMNMINHESLDQYPEFIDFAAEPILLSIVSGYLDAFPILSSIYFWRSRKTNSEAANSQLYHCDHEDIRQLKLFIHISNVEESNGPLTVLNQEISELLRQKLRYRYYSKIPDERIRPFIPAHTEQSITGASGTLAFLDTSQVFHYGSRVAKEDRYVVVIQYVTPTHLSLNPFKPSTLTPLAPLGAKRFNALTRAALGVLDPI